MAAGSDITQAIIYTRVSSDDQAREGMSLDAQLAECRRYAARHGWALGTEYQDVMTGKRDDRPQYQAMLADVRRLHAVGRASVVVVAALDRLGRTLLERVRSREELHRLGVDTHSVREGGIVSDLTANILASVAQEESRRNGERVAASIRHLRANGWHQATPAPLGYTWRSATDAERADGAPRIVLDLDTAAVPTVQAFFRRLAAGESLRSVARWIAALPEAERGGKPLAFTSLQRLLRSSTYMPAPGQRWPAIVDADTVSRAREQVGLHRRVPKQASGRYLLTGFLHCPHCGSRMRGNAQGVKPMHDPNRRRPDYVCSSRDRGAGRANLGCIARMKAHLIDSTVLDSVAVLLDTLGDAALRPRLDRAWTALRQPPEAVDTQRQAQRLAAEQDRAKKRLADAAIKLVDGILDKAGYEAAKARIEDDLRRADDGLAQLRAVTTPTVDLPPLSVVLASAGDWHTTMEQSDTAAQRAVLALLVERISPVRVRRGTYTASITWTPLGMALAQMTVALEGVA